MNNLKRTIPYLVLFVFFSIFNFTIAQSTSEVAFQISEPDLIPEGMAYDKNTKKFFVSSTYKRKVVQISKDGVSKDFVSSGSDGLLGVVGMRVDPKRRTLWVLSSYSSGMPMMNPIDREEGYSRVHKYNIDSGKLIGKYEITSENGRNFFNDLTVAKNGDIYITCSRNKRIYTIKNGSKDLELFLQLDKSMSPNGIDISKSQKYLFVAVYGGKNVIRLDLLSKEFIVIELPEGERISADGLYYYKNSLIAVQPYNKERIVTRYHLNKDWSSVTKFNVLDNNNPNFSQPTTGAIVGNYFYCIANSQLQLFSKKYKNKDESIKLKNPVILKIKSN